MKYYSYWFLNARVTNKIKFFQDNFGKNNFKFKTIYDLIQFLNTNKMYGFDSDHYLNYYQFEIKDNKIGKIKLINEEVKKYIILI